MTPHRIAISQRVVSHDAYPERRDALSQEWMALALELSPDALLVPVPNRIAHVDAYLEAIGCSALILSGGNDWDQAPERDRTEISLMQWFWQRSLPILGVCRGMHVLNILLGGKLTRDIASAAGQSHANHDHCVTLENTAFEALAGKRTLTVNSYHNQGVLSSDLASGLHAFALAEPRIVEGVYHPTEPILGIQWHPERRDPAAHFSRLLLDAFFNHGAFWHS